MRSKDNTNARTSDMVTMAKVPMAKLDERSSGALTNFRTLAPRFSLGTLRLLFNSSTTAATLAFPSFLFSVEFSVALVIVFCTQKHGWIRCAGTSLGVPVVVAVVVVVVSAFEVGMPVFDEVVMAFAGFTVAVSAFVELASLVMTEVFVFVMEVVFVFFAVMYVVVVMSLFVVVVDVVVVSVLVAVVSALMSLVAVFWVDALLTAAVVVCFVVTEMVATVLSALLESLLQLKAGNDLPGPSV